MLKRDFLVLLAGDSDELNAHSGKSLKSVHHQPGMGVQVKSE